MQLIYSLWPEDCTKGHNRLKLQTAESKQAPEKSEINTSTNTNKIDNSGLLQLAKIKLRSKYFGVLEEVAFLDIGYTLSNIENDLAKQLECT